MPVKRLRLDLDLKLDISDHDSELSEPSEADLGAILTEPKQVAALGY